MNMRLGACVCVCGGGGGGGGGSRGIVYDAYVIKYSEFFYKII